MGVYCNDSSNEIQGEHMENVTKLIPRVHSEKASRKEIHRAIEF